MRKIFKKGLAVATTVAMAATLVAGLSLSKPVEVKAEDTDVALTTPWTFYSGGQIGRSSDPDGWPVRYFNSVTTSTGEVKTGWDANFPNKQYVDGGEMTWSSTSPAAGFTADIANTGWDGQYTDANGNPSGTCTADNPYLLRAFMNGMVLEEGHNYTVSFDYKWTNRKNAPEKNIYLTVTDGNTNAVIAKQIKVAAGSTTSVSEKFATDQGSKTVDIGIAMGAFLYSYNSKATTENVAAEGSVQIVNFKIVDNGAIPGYVPTPERPTTEKPTTPQQTVKPTTPAKPGSQDTPKVAKPAQVKNVKAKNSAKKAVKITWKKSARAKSYQVKVGTKKYNTKKLNLTAKKLKVGKKYKVQVRAKNTSGYGKWSKVVKVTIKK